MFRVSSSASSARRARIRSAILNRMRPRSCAVVVRQPPSNAALRRLHRAIHVGGLGGGAGRHRLLVDGSNTSKVLPFLADTNAPSTYI